MANPTPQTPADNPGDTAATENIEQAEGAAPQKAPAVKRLRTVHFQIQPVVMLDDGELSFIEEKPLVVPAAQISLFPELWAQQIAAREFELNNPTA